MMVVAALAGAGGAAVVDAVEAVATVTRVSALPHAHVPMRALSIVLPLGVLLMSQCVYSQLCCLVCFTCCSTAGGHEQLQLKAAIRSRLQLIILRVPF